MKRILQWRYAGWFLAALLFPACKKDNYAAPHSKLTGAVVYQGDTIHVATGQVTFQLWQSGFGKLTPINVNVAENGTFSALLFDGNYKLIFPVGQGPFMSVLNDKSQSDTIPVVVKGNTTLNVEVNPYYMIKGAAFAISDSIVTGSCQLSKIITDANARDVGSVTLYINKTDFVDNNNNIASVGINGSDITDMNDISLQVKVPKLIPTQHYVFARIGVKIDAVDDMIFSPVMKLSF